jgi:flagellar hook assembly protein FlgD
MVTDTLGNSSAFTPNIVISMYSDIADTSSSLPYTFALKQNYPNPFNPSTRIAFTLPRASRVKIDVLNILGQKVATLHSGRLSAGEHAVEWNGTDSGGESVASGVYFYRLTADSLRATRKMLLLK